MATMNRRGAFAALLAALLFGLSTPLAKELLSEIKPVLLAGLLYLGAGIGLGIWLGVQRLRVRHRGEAPLTARDWPWLGGAVLFGGVLGPLLLMLGLERTSAANASLMLNSEAVLTAALAWTVFREHFASRIVWGMLSIVAGVMLLSWVGRPEGTSGFGELLIALACLSWAIDNNLTRKVSGGDPRIISCTKGLIAGGVNTAIALSHGASLPSMPILLRAGLVGFLGYGLSLQFYVIALRHIGTARTGAYFSVAPFAGAALALVLFETSLSAAFVSAAMLMALGVWLHLSERHVHEHVHEKMTHDHRHTHDEHHRHEHETAPAGQEPHSHPHHHPLLMHQHPHYPDLHHRHRNQGPISK